MLHERGHITDHVPLAWRLVLFHSIQTLGARPNHSNDYARLISAWSFILSSTSTRYPPTWWLCSITPRPTLGRPYLIHLLHPLLELLILALLVRMSLGLRINISCPCPIPHGHILPRSFDASRLLSYLTLPRQVIFLEPTAVQRDEQVGAAITVGEGESGGGHFFAGGSPYDANGQSDDCVPFRVESKWRGMTGGLRRTRTYGLALNRLRPRHPAPSPRQLRRRSCWRKVGSTKSTAQYVGGQMNT